jgi:hypothetical protein
LAELQHPTISQKVKRELTMIRILRQQTTQANRVVTRTTAIPQTILFPQTRALASISSSTSSLSFSKRFLSNEDTREGNRSHVHFKLSPKGKALSPSVLPTADEDQCELASGDHTGRQQNHIWTKEELDEALTTLYRHKPQTISDHLMNKFVSLTPSLCLFLSLDRCMVHTTLSIL